ncbi:hypothetical protein [uncultured Thiodictyon sp.]|jgi:hypothetical protein|uniref:hypothetical protein n=1 Tax=uncultured Thiodictyon sp. TaxID=1846217 RepID=UPI0025F54AB6|nr:hypothetical protein [uncultured Thiodictyon sp.]
MLQAIEAEISPDGRVTLLEPLHLSRTVRAVVTILAPLNEPLSQQGGGAALLRILDSPAFAAAPPGDPVVMEREIAANRSAWGD